MSVRKVTRGVSDAPVPRDIESLARYVGGDLTALLKEIRKSINQQAAEYFRIPFRLDYFELSSPSSSFQDVDARVVSQLQAYIDLSQFPSDLVPGCQRKAYLVTWGRLSASGDGELQLFNDTEGAAVSGSTVELSGTTEQLYESGDCSDGLASGMNEYTIQFRQTDGTPNVRLWYPHLLIAYEEL